MGDAQDCNATSAGCFYDSLNVAVTDAAPAVGTEDAGTLKLAADGSFASSLDADATPAVQFKAGS